MGEDKRFILLFLLLFTAYMLFAESPELRKVMPNSWKKVTKLTAQEETRFLRDNAGLLCKIKAIYKEALSNSGFDMNYSFPFIYKQTAGNDIFFRILLAVEKEPDFLSKELLFAQCLIYNGKLILGGEYGSVKVFQRSQIKLYSSLDIIEGKSGAKGVLYTRVSISVNYDFEIYADSYRKGQLVGGGVGRYYIMSDIRNAEESEFNYDSADNYYGFGGGDHGRSGKKYCIEIEASDCLIDADIPLRYSLQNAFDNDPATSFVENTKDDLLFITFIDILYKPIKKLAVINGYAQNMSLYKKNNRVKRFISLKNDSILSDNILSYQYITENVQLFFLVKEVYNGSKYNDTCIAELNFLTEDGWLFGDIDE